MPKIKIPVTLESTLVDELDELVASQRFRSRSHAIEAAVTDLLFRIARTRLAHEAAKLNVNEEQALADEGLVIEDFE